LPQAEIIVFLFEDYKMVGIAQILVRVHANDFVVDKDKYADNHLEIDVHRNRKTSLKEKSTELKIVSDNLSKRD
jgi:hypothetical protein